MWKARPLAAGALLLLASAGGAEAQMFQIVCQTPMFWCVVPAQMPVGGASCWCNSMWGPVGGLTVAPLPNPVRPQPGGPAPVLDLNDNECFDGLGNCDGAFSGYRRR